MLITHSRCVSGCARVLTLAMVLLSAAHAGDPPVAGAQHADRAARRAAFMAKFDTNHDGKLDEPERATARAAMAARLKEKHPEAFKKLDTDGDNTLSKTELEVGKTELKEKLKARLLANHPEADTNHDSQLSREEITTWRTTHPCHPRQNGNG